MLLWEDGSAREWYGDGGDPSDGSGGVRTCGVVVLVMKKATNVVRGVMVLVCHSGGGGGGGGGSASTAQYQWKIVVLVDVRYAGGRATINHHKGCLSAKLHATADKSQTVVYAFGYCLCLGKEEPLSSTGLYCIVLRCRRARSFLVGGNLHAWAAASRVSLVPSWSLVTSRNHRRYCAWFH